MRALAPTYAKKVKMDVVMTSDADATLIEEQFGDSRHGLLIRDAEGKIVSKIDGHNFGPDEILAELKKLGVEIG